MTVGTQNKDNTAMGEKAGLGWETAKGKVKEFAGGLVGNDELKAEGLQQQLESQKQHDRTNIGSNETSWTGTDNRDSNITTGDQVSSGYQSTKDNIAGKGQELYGNVTGNEGAQAEGLRKQMNAESRPELNAY
jgi:uncharacterized protein YjbJ (UPF0337 family)